MLIIRRYEAETYSKWTADVDRVVNINMVKPLLVRNDETLLLTLNFDPEVYISKADEVSTKQQ